MGTMGIGKIVIVSIVITLAVIESACSNIFTNATISSASSQPQAPSFPTFKTRDVPPPALAPWAGVTTYTEQTYQINAEVGQNFAIGKFLTNGVNALATRESHDPKYIEFVDDETIPYDNATLNHYGTKWFLFKAIKAGKTEINFNAPLEYFKVFSISINPSVS